MRSCVCVLMWVACLVVCSFLPPGGAQQAHALGAGERVPLLTFNVTVDETQWTPCIGWGLTPSLAPNETTSREVPIAQCDQGKFVYSYDYNFNFPVIKPVFYSRVILDASPPTCLITCKPTSGEAMPYRCTFCSVMDSREGFHLTTFKFDVIAWKWRQ